MRTFQRLALLAFGTLISLLSEFGRAIANIVTVLLLGVVGVGPANASFLQFDFTGSLWNVNENIQGIVPFAVGTQFSGNFTWDDANSVHSFTWNIGGNVFQSVAQPDVLIDNGSFDAFQVVTYAPSLPSGWSTSGGDVPFIQFYLRDDSGTVFNDTSLPTSLDLSDFSQTSIGFFYQPTQQSPATLTTPLGQVTSFVGSNIAFQGHIESIPEPGVIFLLALGLAGLAFTRRRRQ